MTNPNEVEPSIHEASFQDSPVSFLRLPCEIHLSIASYLKQCELLPLVQTCKIFHKLFTPLVWSHIGFSPSSYSEQGRQFRQARPCLSCHASPSISKFVNTHEPQGIDKLSYLLILGNVSKLTLSYVKSITLCAGYDFTGLGVDRLNIIDMYLRVDSFRSCQGYYFNILAAIDLAICDVLSEGEINNEKSNYYEDIFGSVKEFELWEHSLQVASESIKASQSFESLYLHGHTLPLGLPKNGESEITGLPTSSVTKPDDRSRGRYTVESLVLNTYTFQDMLVHKLLIPEYLTNLSTITLDIGGSTFQSPFRHSNENYCARKGVLLLKTLATIINGFPALKIALNFNSPNIGFTDFNTPDLLEILPHITILRAVVLEQDSEFPEFSQFLLQLEQLEKLEIITQRDKVFIMPSDDEIRELANSITTVLKFPSLTTFHLSSIPLMPVMLALLPELTIPNLELKFSRPDRSTIKSLFSQKLEGTTCLRLDCKIHDYRIPSGWKIGFTGLEELHFRHFDLPRATLEEILRKNPGLDVIEYF